MHFNWKVWSRCWHRKCGSRSDRLPVFEMICSHRALPSTYRPEDTQSKVDMFGPFHAFQLEGVVTMLTPAVWLSVTIGSHLATAAAGRRRRVLGTAGGERVAEEERDRSAG